eukprot:6202502-Pleurochrysis_carterae.AAC.2
MLHHIPDSLKTSQRRVKGSSHDGDIIASYSHNACQFGCSALVLERQRRLAATRVQNLSRPSPPGHPGAAGARGRCIHPCGGRTTLLL